MAEAKTMSEGRGYKGNLYLPLNFVTNLKLLDKIKSIKTKLQRDL